MIISIASGKGGTGKTTIAVNLALSLKGKAQLLDCDVEEPDDHIFLEPKITKSEKVYLPKPFVNPDKCDYCGRCSEVCQYNAIAVVKNKDRLPPGKVLIFYELCHSCGACKIACPQNAIFEKEIEKGIVEEGKTKTIFFVQGKLREGESSPVPLVKAVKKRIKKDHNIIIDASPGTSCPVVEAVKDSDFCLLVTEPTPFGLNDLRLAVEMCRKIKIPSGVIINRADIGDKKVEEYCAEENIPILMRIPYSREIAYAYSEGIPIVEKFPEYRKKFQELFEKIKLDTKENNSNHELLEFHELKNNNIKLD